MSAILFGSISTLADTSEAQRQAFNSAFEAHGLKWHWDRDDYRAMLSESGGQNRIASFAASVGQEVDAAAIHQTKCDLFHVALAETPPPARPGVVETVRAAKRDGINVALVTTTSSANVASLLAALSPDLQRTDFDLVVDANDVEKSKPDSAAYSYAIGQLGETPSECIAIEDNVAGVQSAVSAGLRCIAFPNQNTAGHAFEGAHRTVDAIDFGDLQPLIVRS